MRNKVQEVDCENIVLDEVAEQKSFVDFQYGAVSFGYVFPIVSGTVAE